MRRAIISIFVLGALAVWLPADLVAQQADVVNTLPQRTPPPRTLEAYWAVFAGLSIAWLAIMGYYLSLSARAGRISEGIARSQGSEPS